MTMRAQRRWQGPPWVWALLTASACAAPTAEGAWKMRLDTLQRDPDPQAALRCSDLAYAAETEHPEWLTRLGLDPAQVARVALASLYGALKGRPTWEDIPAKIDQWRDFLGGRFDAGPASEAVCAAADARHTLSLYERCGDLLLRAGRREEAVARYRALVPLASEPAVRNALIVRLERASAHPDTDLAGVSSTELQIANAWQATREHGEAAEQAERACRAQCDSEHTSCSVASEATWGFSSGCDQSLEVCEASCGRADAR